MRVYTNLLMFYLIPLCDKKSYFNTLDIAPFYRLPRLIYPYNFSKTYPLLRLENEDCHTRRQHL